MNRLATLALLLGLGTLSSACNDASLSGDDDHAEASAAWLGANSTDGSSRYQSDSWEREPRTSTGHETLCDGQFISYAAAEEMLELTERSDDEDVYSTYERVDGIAALFEECGDPWGMFPTTYRRITARGVQAIEDGEFEDEEWAERIIVDFAGRYMDNLAAALTGEGPSWAWSHYYRLADRDDVSPARAVVVGMVAPLTLDLPYSLVAIDTQEHHEDDFFVFGEMMIEVSDLLIDDLLVTYDTDAEDLLTGFFFGDWIDGTFGADTTITVTYQTIRTKSWNNRWLLEQGWGGWIAAAEIWAAFWAVDGILASMDAAGTI